MTDTILQQIAEDVRIIKTELTELKAEVKDLREIDLEVRPEYLEKLKKIDSGNFKEFSSIEDLRRQIEHDQ